jgi:hypothetical protein
VGDATPTVIRLVTRTVFWWYILKQYIYIYIYIVLNYVYLGTVLRKFLAILLVRLYIMVTRARTPFPMNSLRDWWCQYLNRLKNVGFSEFFQAHKGLSVLKYWVSTR